MVRGRRLCRFFREKDRHLRKTTFFRWIPRKNLQNLLPLDPAEEHLLPLEYQQSTFTRAEEGSSPRKNLRLQPQAPHRYEVRTLTWMAEGNKQRKPMEEEPNGGEAGDNESQHGGEEARREETNGAEEEEAKREANLKWKIAGSLEFVNLLSRILFSRTPTAAPRGLVSVAIARDRDDGQSIDIFIYILVAVAQREYDPSCLWEFMLEILGRSSPYGNAGLQILDRNWGAGWHLLLLLLATKPSLRISFLHPADSKNPKLHQWLCKEEVRPVLLMELNSPAKRNPHW
ncbi:hypothetical protein JHK82_042960 [Glycine max]|nr:hypothetical protein JHK82_042960 [Glycine max]